jgi:hypothetical protein
MLTQQITLIISGAESVTACVCLIQVSDEIAKLTLQDNMLSQQTMIHSVVLLMLFRYVHNNVPSSPSYAGQELR